MTLPKLTNDYIIDKLHVQPIGDHQWAQLTPGDPDQFNLYRNNHYILLLRSHLLGIQNGPDAFEIILGDGETILHHEDVPEDDMNKTSILNAIRTYNSGWDTQTPTM